MFVEKKKIGSGTYLYLRVSARYADKVKTKTIAYLGKSPMSGSEVKAAIDGVPRSKIDSAKKILAEELRAEQVDINSSFLDEKALEDIEAIKEDFSKKLHNKDKQLIDDMFRDFKTYFIYNTTAIEGNTLSLAQANLLLNENQTPDGKDLREVYDHINERDTFDWLLTLPEISKDLIVEIHARLMKGIDIRTGSFREHNVRVFGVSLKTTPAEYVSTDMTILLRWYNKNKKKLHPLVLAAIFHEKFERIHPFYDGNGRTGRMILNLILMRAGYPPLIIKKSSRKAYFDALSAGHKAELTKDSPEHYGKIVSFCHKQLKDTYKKIFEKWG